MGVTTLTLISAMCLRLGSVGGDDADALAALVLALNFSVVLGSLMAVVGIVLRQVAKVSRKVLFLFWDSRVLIILVGVFTRVFNVSCSPLFSG
jgi:hypothetical membrane protein